jgi:hypothetical protein
MLLQDVWSIAKICASLVAWLLLLLAVEGVQANAGDLDDLETDSGLVSNGLARATASSNKDLVVLFNEVKSTIVRDEGDDLLAVLDQLNLDALTNGRVRLLGFNTNLLEDDTLGVGRSSEGIGARSVDRVRLLPALVGPPALSANANELTGCALSVDLGHSP